MNRERREHACRISLIGNARRRTTRTMSMREEKGDGRTEERRNMRKKDGMERVERERRNSGKCRG